jgi:hypothetical protein
LNNVFHLNAEAFRTEGIEGKAEIVQLLCGIGQLALCCQKAAANLAEVKQINTEQ